MNVQELTLKFVTQPYNLQMGAGKLANIFKVTRDDIYIAKKEARKIIENMEKSSEEETSYIGSESTPEGVVRKYKSSHPLSPKEIEKLVGSDGITTTVARVWDKLLPNGTWTYSIDLRYRIKDFYDAKELKEKLKQIMPNITPYSKPFKKVKSNKALIILIADDHVGAVNITDIYKKSNTSYKNRLLNIVEEAKLLNETFEEVHVISIGDQLNGWNSQTTRGGHEVKSLSNKEQFDIYTSSRIAFYNDLFSSGVGGKYVVHDVENSNHCGNSFSYISNQFIHMYLSCKFPTVECKSYFDAIDGFEYGKHLILMGHGKDEKFMKKPMPSVLDPRTDLYLYELINIRKLNNSNTTFYKGDLHIHGLQHGKFGRYVNVPSIAGNSDYIDLNFGNSRGGALFEILEKDSYKISSKAIWFK